MSGIHYTVMLKVPCLEDVCGSGDIAPHNLQAPAANIGIQLEFVLSRTGDMTPLTHFVHCFQEYGHPYKLLQKNNGYFYELVEETGPAMAEQLQTVAEEVTLCLLFLWATNFSIQFIKTQNSVRSFHIYVQHAV